MKNINYRVLKFAFILFALVITNLFIIKYIDIDFKIGLDLSFDVKSNSPDEYQMFYMCDENEQWSGEKMVSDQYKSAGSFSNISGSMPKNVKYIRIDTGNCISDVVITNLQLSKAGNSFSLFDDKVKIAPENDISYFNINKDNNTIDIKTSSNDPYFIIDLTDVNLDNIYDPSELYNTIAKAILCIISSVFVIAIGLKAKFVIEVFKTIFQNKKMIWSLSKNDFKTKFAGSFFGIIWAFIQPVVTVVVYWFVFEVGLKSTGVGNFPFALWFVAGLVPWFFFSDALIAGTMSLFEYSYLVKKVVFKISIIPVVKVISALFVHLFFVLFTILLFMCYGYYPDIYTSQILYYTFCLVVFTLGLAYLTCSIVVFFKDLSQIVNIFLQIGMWMTPIMWNYNIIGEKYRIFFKLNPIFYIVEGYRDSLIDKYWFWERINYSVYFWLVTIGIFGLGTIIFRKLKVHFADIL